MPDRPNCPRCGAELLPGSPRNLCPACLLRLGTGERRPESCAHGAASATPPPTSPGAGTLSILDSIAATLGPVPRVLLRDTTVGRTRPRRSSSASTEMPAAAGGGGRLQLLGEIARGGMGAVLKGRDPDLGRDLAVKVLLEAPPRPARAGPPVRRGGADRRPASAPGDRAGLRARPVRRPAAVLLDEAGQGPHPGRSPQRSRRPAPTSCPRTSRPGCRSARRWPTRTPGA